MEIKKLTGLAGISELSNPEKYSLSQLFEVPGEDSWPCLTVKFVYENGEWKVSGYGLGKNDRMK